MSTEVGHHVWRQLTRSVIKYGWLYMICRMHPRVCRIVLLWGDDVSIKGCPLYDLDDKHGGD